MNFKFLLRTRRNDETWILETLPISHYVDKVRWCMDKAKIPYKEEKDIGIFWILTTGRLVPTLKIPGLGISISNSSDILKYLYGHVQCLDEEKAKLRSEQLKIEYENALYAKERESKKAMELATELTDSLNKKRFEKNTIVCIF